MGSILPSAELERMASELRCPICLSLYKQAASLSCNHCFCTACIVQSMKRTSCCPICKVPAVPREVRSAPQMDSLVAIFKGMETSAGVSLFHTQQPSQLQSPDAGEHLAKQKGIGRKLPKSRGIKQEGHVLNHATLSGSINISHLPRKRRRGKSQDFPDKRNQRPEYGMRREMKGGGEDLSIRGAVPIPARKKIRAHPRPCDAHNTGKAELSKRQSVCSEPKVTLSSRMANPLIPENEEISLGENLSRVDMNDEGLVFQEEEMKDLQNTCFSNFDPSEVEPPQLSPFFWVRDRVLPSQDEPPTQITQTQGAARPLRPSFSDLKDSDDNDNQFEDVRRPDWIAGTELPDSCDSDMFVWSQRPCSPELSSSPEENFEDQLRHSKPKSFVEEEFVLGKDENARRGVEDDEPESPLNCDAKAPVAVEATQTPQLRQEPSRMTRGSLSKSSKLKTRQSDQFSRKMCRRLKTFDQCSFLNNKADNLFEKSVNPKNSIAKGAQNFRRTSYSSCDEIGLESSLDCNLKDPPPVDITAEVTLEHSCAHQNDILDAAPEHEQHDTCGRERNAQDGELNHKSVTESSPSCVFCGSSGDSEVAGPLLEYKDAFPSRGQTRIEAILVHKLCAEWAPDVYFSEDEPRNLACEVKRGLKIKCSSCRMRGAALGCCNRRCKKSFHYPCGRATPGCKWDEDDFVMFCPQHADCKFPRRKRCRISSVKGPNLFSQEKEELDKTVTPGVRTGELPQKWPTGPACRWILCGSGLDSEMKREFSAFASVTGASVVKRWSPNVTHVITGTDEQGGARRTLKFLLGLLHGKWIVTTEWMSACLSAGHIVSEDQYEVTSDINGCKGGPQRSRAITATKGPKLLEGLSFYFFGEFTSVSKEDLQSLIVAGRGVVLHRKPLLRENLLSNGRVNTIILFNGNGAKQTNAVMEEAKSLAVNVGASAVPHTWLLDSVAACELQPMH